MHGPASSQERGVRGPDQLVRESQAHRRGHILNPDTAVRSGDRIQRGLPRNMDHIARPSAAGVDRRANRANCDRIRAVADHVLQYAQKIVASTRAKSPQALDFCKKWLAWGAGPRASLNLILAAKAIARYPEFKSEHFAEYFLIGTLLSFSIAVVGGALLARVVLGEVRIAG